MGARIVLELARRGGVLGLLGASGITNAGPIKPGHCSFVVAESRLMESKISSTVSCGTCQCGK